jgi:aminopeptidase N
VTNKTWNHIWLNEGFATYSEALWAQYKPGSSGSAALQSAMLSRKPSDPGDSVYVTNVSDMNRIFSSAYSYRKGAWVLHQLRRMIGDAAFFDGLKEYRRIYQGSAATTEDFAAVMSAVAGTDLTNYFEQGVYGVGAPSYAIGLSPVQIAGLHYAKVSIRQTQNAAWPGRGTPGNSYVLPLDLRFTTTSGTQDAVVNNGARTQHYVIPLGSAASAVALDPNNWVLNYGKVSEAYIAGPPKVVAATPSQGQSLDSSPDALRITFSENVTIPVGSWSLRDSQGQTVPATSSFANPTLTITPNSALAGGEYSLALTPAITANGQSLDGEPQAALPSGDGLPGGAFSLTFTVDSPCPGDFNQDGGVDGTDVEAFFISWSQADAAADVNQDGGVDGSDVEAFFIAWTSGGC